MAGRRKEIGKYRHVAATGRRIGGRVTVAPRWRRRFPYLGMVVAGYALLGTLTCAGVSGLGRAAGLPLLLPERVTGQPLPPAPSLDHVLFGAGAAETALACAVAGWLVWRALWNTRLPDDLQNAGFGAALGVLMRRAVVLGPLLALTAIPIGVFGLYLRTAPETQPLLVRPLFGLLAAPLITASALLTGTVPLVVAALGLLLGVVTALGVAWFWQHYPEEPVGA